MLCTVTRMIQHPNLKTWCLNLHCPLQVVVPEYSSQDNLLHAAYLFFPPPVLPHSYPQHHMSHLRDQYMVWRCSDFSIGERSLGVSGYSQVNMDFLISWYRVTFILNKLWSETCEPHQRGWAKSSVLGSKQFFFLLSMTEQFWSRLIGSDEMLHEQSLECCFIGGYWTSVYVCDLSMAKSGYKTRILNFQNHVIFYTLHERACLSYPDLFISVCRKGVLAATKAGVTTVDTFFQIAAILGQLTMPSNLFRQQNSSCRDKTTCGAFDPRVCLSCAVRNLYTDMIA